MTSPSLSLVLNPPLLLISTSTSTSTSTFPSLTLSPSLSPLLSPIFSPSTSLYVSPIPSIAVAFVRSISSTLHA